MKQQFTLKQVMSQVHSAYDHIEEIARKVLKDEFGFGDVRMQRFMDAFGEKSAQECERIRAELRRKRL